MKKKIKQENLMLDVLKKRKERDVGGRESQWE